jgi:hypothetical protein
VVRSDRPFAGRPVDLKENPMPEDTFEAIGKLGYVGMTGLIRARDEKVISLEEYRACRTYALAALRGDRAKFRVLVLGGKPV